MADSPWAGINDMNNHGALEQRLYQEQKPESASPTPVEVKHDTAPTVKPLKKASVVETPAVVEQEIRMTLPLPESSISFLDQIERTIFIKRDIKYRSKQRITKNSVARSWISLLKEVDINWTEIKDEADLTSRLRKVLEI
jgi:hypothetical protein